MAREVIWTPARVETFISLAGFDNMDDTRYADIMRYHARGFSITKICMLLCISKSTYDKDIRHCKHVYDIVQSEHPDKLPMRNKKSAFNVT